MSLTIDQLQFTYPGSTAGIFDIDLTVKTGELLAVIGASGSGKTTLLKLIAGFETADAGQITLNDTDITHSPVQHRELGLVFQSYALFPHMSAWQNVAYPLKVRKIPPPRRRGRAFEALERVGLRGFETRKPLTLSGGQQQRVALARALVFAPRALLLDEPLSALDAGLRSEMRDEILRIQRDFGIATLLITHDQEEALSMADRVAVMQQGRIVQVARPKKLYDSPRNRFVAGFVGEANLWEGRVENHRQVSLDFGALAVPSHNLPAGTPVTVMVRPEHVIPQSGEDQINTFQGPVVADRFLGAVRRFDLAVGNALIQGQTDCRDHINVVHIRPEHIRLLPATL